MHCGSRESLFLHFSILNYSCHHEQASSLALSFHIPSLLPPWSLIPTPGIQRPIAPLSGHSYRGGDGSAAWPCSPECMIETEQVRSEMNSAESRGSCIDNQIRASWWVRLWRLIPMVLAHHLAVVLVIDGCDRMNLVAHEGQFWKMFWLTLKARAAVAFVSLSPPSPRLLRHPWLLDPPTSPPPSPPPLRLPPKIAPTPSPFEKL